MALPLKSGADFYTQEIRRVALQNEGSDLPEYLSGSIYFNTNSESNTSDRIRYRGRNAWHSVANLEDIARLEGLISDLGDVSGGNITDLLNKIEALEGNFTDGAANDSLKLAGQLPSYYATASGLSALQEKVSAFLDGEVDSDAVLENLKEIQAFLDSYDGATSLADMFAAVNTQIADRYTKGEVETKLSAYRLLTNGTFDVLVNAKNGIETDEITIGGIKLSVVEGQLQIDGDAFATGQLASGGIGEAGSGSGASEIVILEDWSKYDDSVAQVVGAVLGKDLYDRLGVAESTLESLVGKATNVSVVQTLTSGKEIGAITIDGVATKLYAPATYAWGEITSKPTTAAGYGITDAAKYYGAYSVDSARYGVGYDNMSQGSVGLPVVGGGFIAATQGKYGFQIIGGYSSSSHMFWRNVDNDTLGTWHKVLDDTNYASVLDNAYLKLSGGEIKGTSASLLGINRTDGSPYIAYYANGVLKGYMGVGDNGTTYMDKDGVPFVMLNLNNYSSYVLPIRGGTMQGVINTSQRIRMNGSVFEFNDINESNAVYLWNAIASGRSERGIVLYNGTAWNMLIHEGNFNTYGTSKASGTWRINVSGTANSLAPEYVNDVNNATHSRFFYSGFQASNRPATNYATGLTLYNNSAGYYFQLAYDTSGLMYSRVKPNQGSYSSWKTLAFTDSDITGNAAGLKHSNGTIGVILNSSGNVTIGGSDLAGTGYKLHVTGGLTYIETHNTSNPTLGYLPSKGLVLGLHTNGIPQFGITCWTRDNGNGNIQVSRFTGEAEAFSLCLNPLGGSVGIGTTSPVARLHIYGDSPDGYALKVNGHTSLSAGLTVTGGYISMPTEYGLLFDSSEVLYKATNGSLRFGYCQGWSGQNTYISGANIVFNSSGTGESEVMRMTQTSLILAQNKTLKIGDATLSWDSTSNALKVDKDFYSDGQVSSGGVAEEGTGGAAGGSGLERVVFTIPANTTTFDCVHNLGTREISVTIYEEGNDYQQVLADVYLDSTNIARIVFGSATNVAHKVVIIG